MSREVRGASLWRSATVRFARERVTGVGRLAPMNPRRLGAPPADASGRQRTPADGAATIYEKSTAQNGPGSTIVTRVMV